MNRPIGQMIHRADLYGHAYQSEKGGKKSVPLLKKKGIKCFVQDTPPQIITWYSQRQEKVSQSMYLCDKTDYLQFAITDEVHYDGLEYRVAGRRNEAGMGVVFRVDLVEIL